MLSTRKYHMISQNNLQKVTNDVIKFIPFSLFIIVPGLELLLPAWLVIFPNSIPSQFLSSSARQKQMEELIQNRNKAAERLLYKYPKYLKRLSKNPNLSEVERNEVLQLVEYIENGTYMHTDLLKFKHIFKKYADFRHFKVNTLLEMAHFMGLKPITGLNTINNLLSFFKLNIKLDNRYVSWYTKLILRRELRMYMRKIRKGDIYLSMEDIHTFPQSKIDSILVERGIEIENRPIEKKLKDYKIWQAISNLGNVPDTLLIFCRVNDFAEDLYRINYFEQEIDLIKRIGSNKLYLQRKNTLDDFLGIRKVKEYINFVSSLKQPQNKLKTNEEVKTNQTSVEDQNANQSADAAVAKQPEVPFSEIEAKYREYSEVLTEFRIRHNVIIDEIDNVNEVNKKLLDELEQYVILGFLDRQEQRILYEKYADICLSLKQTPDSKSSKDSKDTSNSKINENDLQRIIDLSKEFSNELKGKEMN